ncbi:MAG: hypothetical protein ACYDCO_07370 [Armatimonadota bacterium]
MRFTERIPTLTHSFPVFKDAFITWARMLEMAEGSFIKADISELLESQAVISEHLATFTNEKDERKMYSDEELRVREALSFLTSPSKSTWESLLNITALRHHLISKNGKVVLDAGWPYVVLGIRVADWLPWKEK